jgi:hypothetical protein
VLFSEADDALTSASTLRSTIMKYAFSAAGLGLAISGVASAAFTGYSILATPTSNSGQSLVRYELFANLNGPTDTVLNVFNFQAQGGWAAHPDAACGFWHKDYCSSGVLSQVMEPGADR